MSSEIDNPNIYFLDTAKTQARVQCDNTNKIQTIKKGFRGNFIGKYREVPYDFWSDRCTICNDQKTISYRCTINCPKCNERSVITNAKL